MPAAIHVWIFYVPLWYSNSNRLEYIELRSSFRKFLEFAGVIYRNGYCELKKTLRHLSSSYGCGQKETPRKKRTNSWFLFHDDASAHRLVLVKDFLTENNVTTLEHPTPTHTLLTWLQLIFTCSVYLKHWRDDAFLMLLTSLRMRRKTWKSFHEMASRNVSNTVTVAGRSV